MYKVTEEGRIHLSFQNFVQVRLTHFVSGVDDAHTNANQGGALHSSITGYTEWLNDEFPQITMGWDWEMYYANSRLQMRRIGKLRSNVMVYELRASDLDYQKSMNLQEMVIDGISWQPVVQKEIAMRYS